MANIAAQRIQRELRDVVNSEELAKCGIKLELVNDKYTELKAEISGPPDTPYEGGNFDLEIKVFKTYPFKPPKVQFTTYIWHPNIHCIAGTICLNILKDQWTATMTLRTLLLSLQALLSAAEPDYPEDTDAAQQYKTNRKMFQMTARHWTNAYAEGPHANKEFDYKVRKLIEMGTYEFWARYLLSCDNWDLERAAMQLSRHHLPFFTL